LIITNQNIPIVIYRNAGVFAKYYGTENALSTNENNYSLNTTTIYPNPVKNTFSISGNEAVNEIEIYDLIGKRVLHKKNITNDINIENLPNGIYVAKIKTDKGVFSTKLIKE